MTERVVSVVLIGNGCVSDPSIGVPIDLRREAIAAAARQDPDQAPQNRGAP